MLTVLLCQWGEANSTEALNCFMPQDRETQEKLAVPLWGSATRVNTFRLSCCCWGQRQTGTRLSTAQIISYKTGEKMSNTFGDSRSETRGEQTNPILTCRRTLGAWITVRFLTMDWLWPGFFGLGFGLPKPLLLQNLLLFFPQIFLLDELSPSLLLLFPYPVLLSFAAATEHKDSEFSTEQPPDLEIQRIFLCIITEPHPFSVPPQPPAAACAAAPPRPCAAASGGTPPASWPAHPLPSAHPEKSKGMENLRNSGQCIKLHITRLLIIPGKFEEKVLLLEILTILELMSVNQNLLLLKKILTESFSVLLSLWGEKWGSSYPDLFLNIFNNHKTF